MRDNGDKPGLGIPGLHLFLDGRESNIYENKDVGAVKFGKLVSVD